jgi:pseudouridine kinase
MLAAEGYRMLRLPCVKAEVVNTTGAGDAAMAALVWAGVQSLDLERSARAALLAGAVTCECLEANNPKLGEIADLFFPQRGKMSRSDR